MAFQSLPFLFLNHLKNQLIKWMLIFVHFDDSRTSKSRKFDLLYKWHLPLNLLKIYINIISFDLCDWYQFQLIIWASSSATVNDVSPPFHFCHLYLIPCHIKYQSYTLYCRHNIVTDSMTIYQITDGL